MNKYIIDIGSFLCGRTIEVEANTATKAYFLGRAQLNENKFEKIIQIRNSSGTVFYSYWDEESFIPDLD